MHRAHRRRRPRPLPLRGTARSRRRGRPATNDAATRLPPSTISRVMPFSASACSTAGRSSPDAPFGGMRDALAHRPRRGGLRLPLRRASEAITQSGVSRAVRTSWLAAGMRRLWSSTTRTGERASMPGRRQLSCGSSASTVPMPTRMASLERAQQMHAIAHGLARDRERLATGSADLAVGRDRELQDHVRALVPDAAEMTGMVERGLRRRTGPTSTVIPAARSARGPGPRLPDWDPRSPPPPARCRPRSPRRRKAATCRNASRARA